MPGKKAKEERKSDTLRKEKIYSVHLDNGTIVSVSASNHKEAVDKATTKESKLA
jgi:hypothetical protein